MTRIGVTGHRAIPHEAFGHVRAALTKALTEALRAPRGVGDPVEALSSLAAGADQLFAEIALDCGARLTVVTPADDYESTFSPAELIRFRALLDRADSHVTLGYTRVSGEAYYAAGAYIADHCDLILAVWDGRPARGRGGTADVVHYARALGRPVSVIWKPGAERP
ncbi:hypothetical protein V2S66_11455 [Streptomyces sp. V4-01]|uniref:Uncharacterized protein n=1 Tax=Actinacidiphila polyblastidii TaxID=3110430 RepID=A0ABU7P9U8_9ACTN|nr:hypothetical protein [Streptomyces sp. V4-01]